MKIVRKASVILMAGLFAMLLTAGVAYASPGIAASWAKGSIPPGASNTYSVINCQIVVGDPVSVTLSEVKVTDPIGVTHVWTGPLPTLTDPDGVGGSCSPAATFLYGPGTTWTLVPTTAITGFYTAAACVAGVPGPGPFCTLATFSADGGFKVPEFGIPAILAAIAGFGILALRRRNQEK